MDQETPLALAPELGQRDAEAEVGDQRRRGQEDTDVVERRFRRRRRSSCRLRRRQQRQVSPIDVDRFRRQESENADFVEFRRQQISASTEEVVDQRRQAGRAASVVDDAFKIRFDFQLL